MSRQWYFIFVNSLIFCICHLGLVGIAPFELLLSTFTCVIWEGHSLILRMSKNIILVSTFSLYITQSVLEFSTSGF